MCIYIIQADAGHYVLVFDLWGRGYSDAPPAYYDESLYTNQLALLLQKVGWHSDVDVVGVSLGGKSLVFTFFLINIHAGIGTIIFTNIIVGTFRCYCNIFYCILS